VFIGERPYSAHVMEDFLKKEFGCNKRLGDISRPRLMIMTAVVDKRPVDLHVFRNYISPAELLGEVNFFTAILTMLVRILTLRMLT